MTKPECPGKEYFKTDETVKKWFKQKCMKEPEKHYPIKTLKEYGFFRRKCKCEQWFWTVNKKQKVCGEPVCSGGFRFIDDSPCTKKLDYIQAWQEFVRIHKELGYTPVKRYPVVARWNPTTEFTIASIAAFQPYVVSGEVEPPANPLIIPQFCLRFQDIDNVGITSAHFVAFVMLGEHAFVSPKKYNINKYFKDHLTWLTKGMGLPLKEITVHEDAWAGGGNFGPCVEFFVRGLEVSNQVYMQYEIVKNKCKELNIKVLDMGQGHERVPWLTQGTVTAYDATFPTVLEKLKAKISVKIDKDLLKKFIPYAPFLNVLEVDDIEKAWQTVAEKIDMKKEDLKSKILPIAALYSIAEHSRALLVALSDGALPSNVGGMYNLRVLFRRAQGFIDKYRWNIDIPTICRWHAEYLKPIFPELLDELDNVTKILNVEKEKYKATKENITELIKKVVQKEINIHELIDLYDCHGIMPELIKEEAAKLGKKIDIPENFCSLVSQKHEQAESDTITERKDKISIGKLRATKAMYFDDWTKVEFKAKVLKIVDTHIVLDRTSFYPISGGQMNDTGVIEKIQVIDVFKQGNNIIHTLNKKPGFKEGDDVICKINYERRRQLTQHHTATHLINAASRIVLGNHVNQASARKEIDKAYLDITHYKPISESEKDEIEKIANEFIKKEIKIHLKFMPRTDAEKEYGVRIYQGGAVPGKSLRIVDIPGVDVEACGGTHLNNTSEAEQILILKISKVKDGVMRIMFSAGKAALKKEQADVELVNKISKFLDVKPSQIPARSLELFNKWKKARKLAKKKQKIDISEFELINVEEYPESDILEKTAELLKTQVSHLLGALKRFKEELDSFKLLLK